MQEIIALKIFVKNSEDGFFLILCNLLTSVSIIGFPIILMSDTPPMEILIQKKEVKMGQVSSSDCVIIRIAHQPFLYKQKSIGMLFQTARHF